MPEVRVTTVSREEASYGVAEFWCGHELMAFTLIENGELHLRIDPRSDGEPWLIETASLVRGIAEAERIIASV